MLITHRGLSGPAILQISSYWNKPRANPPIDLAPRPRSHRAHSAIQSADEPCCTSRSESAKVLPHRLADRWLELHAPASWTNLALAEFEQQTTRLGDHAGRNRRLRKSRSHCRRHRHRRTLSQNHGEPQSPGPVLHRRSRRRHRPTRRLQLSVGVGLRRSARDEHCSIPAKSCTMPNCFRK